MKLGGTRILRPFTGAEDFFSLGIGDEGDKVTSDWGLGDIRYQTSDF